MRYLAQMDMAPRSRHTTLYHRQDLGARSGPGRGRGWGRGDGTLTNTPLRTACGLRLANAEAYERAGMNQTPEPLIELTEIIRRLAHRSPDYAPERHLNLCRRCSAEVLDKLRQQNTDILCAQLWVDPDAVGPQLPKLEHFWVPASTWGTRKFDFRSGEFEPDQLGMSYKTARIGQEEARQLWPEIFGEPDQSAPLPERHAEPSSAIGEAEPLAPARSSAGRKPKYEEVDFFILCVWEASANELPEKQSAFVERMGELLQVVWGEGHTPGETWLKERVSRLYAAREKYERGRQVKPGE